MLDIGWSELAVVAVLALVIIGPKDLPGVMRTVGHWMRKARSVSREFQSSVDEMIREADLEDARKAISDTKNMNIGQTIEDTLDPDGEVKQTARSLDSEARREPTSDDGGGDAGDGEPETKATIVKHPVKIAPPHSLTPPQEPSSDEPEPSSPPASEEKTASGGGGA